MLATGSKSLTGFRLSIRSSADGFSFSVSSTLDGSVVQTDRFSVAEPAAAPDVLRQALQKPYLMDYRFLSVELVADTKSTIVPLEHFNKSDMLAFYRLCFPTANTQRSTVNGQRSMVNGQWSMVNGQWSTVNGQRSTVNVQCSMADMQYQILSSLEAVMVFRIDQNILRIVQECYADVKVCCTDAQQLEHFAVLQEKHHISADAEQRDAYVSIGDNRFFVAVFHRNKLQYAGSQVADNDSDRTFLLLGIWKALEMNAQRDICHLRGASDELQKIIGEYILNLE